MLKHKFGRSLLLLAILASAVLVSCGQGQVAAVDSLQAVAESYQTSGPLQHGMIVQLDDKSKRAVVPASVNAPKKMFGVTVSPSETAISISSQDAQQAYVVTSGRYNVLVSNQNGAVNNNDFITISSIDGIGMRADDRQSTVLGRAVGSFNGKQNVLSTTKVKQADGREVSVAISSMVVDISIRSNPDHNSTGGVPAFLQNLAGSVVGAPVNGFQLYGSLAILFIGLGIVAVLIYSGIQTSMVALGRNPLARQSILRNMFQVIITGVSIFIGCLIAVYLILKL